MADQRCRDWHRPDAYLDRDRTLDTRPVLVVCLDGAERRAILAITGWP